MSSRDAVLGVGASLAAPPADVLVREAFGAELAQQRDLCADVGFADLAHIVMSIEAGIVPRADGAVLLAGLLELQACSDTLVLDPMLGDVYTNREARLGAQSAAAGWLGVGRARREAVTTGFALTLRRRALGFVQSLVDAGEALIACAGAHAGSLMPDYTYLQAGQPTTFAHYVLGFVYPLLRDLDRARSLFTRLDCCPAGVGSTNGSTLPVDRERLADLLGFARVVEHARDAMWQADGPIEVLGVTCAAIVNLDRLAEDLAIFSTAEFGFIELADAHSRASKVMPQKKNPYALTYIRSVANHIIGVQAGLAAAGRTPSGQMDNRLDAYGEVPKALADVTGAASLMAAVIRGLAFDSVAARAALDRSFAFASDLAEVVMREGKTDYRTAHALVGRVCRTLRGQNGAAGSASGDAIDAAARALLGHPLHLSPESLAAALDPRLAVARRRGVGGAAAERVGAMIAACREQLAETASWHARTADRLAYSEQRLIEFAGRLAQAR